MARPKSERPFGWEVDVAILESIVKRGKRTFHYRGCSRSDAATKAILRRTDYRGEKIASTDVLEIRPVSEEEWKRAYGVGRM